MSLMVNLPLGPRIWDLRRGQAKLGAAALRVNEKRGKGLDPVGLSTALVGLAILAVSTVLCTAMVLSAHSTGAGKMVSSKWVWLITVFNLTSLYGVSRGWRWALVWALAPNLWLLPIASSPAKLASYPGTS